MNHKHRGLAIFTLAVLLALTVVAPARAFDGRSGDRIVVESGEVVDDDLYVGAQEFVLDGTVNGDLIVFAQTVTINGKVDGDLIAAAQTVAVNGEVTGAVRMAGSVLFVGENVSIGGDIVAAGQRIGLIRFGSRVDVYLPEGTAPKVALGTHTVAGETVLAYLGDNGQVGGILQ